MLNEALGIEVIEPPHPKEPEPPAKPVAKPGEPKQVVSFEQSPAAFSTSADSVENRLSRGEQVARDAIQRRYNGLVKKTRHSKADRAIIDFLKGKLGM